MNLNQITQPNLDDLAYTMELQLILSDVTTQFVSLEQHELLMFVLGQEPSNIAGQSCNNV